MIQPNELRKTNLVLYNGEVREVASINSDDTIRLWQDKPAGYTIGCLMLNEVSGIELTEEWLEKIGWIKHISENYTHPWWTSGNSIIILHKGYNKYAFEFGRGRTKILDYVHQLQNLFYSISGQELTIKSKRQCSKPVKNEPLNDICEKCNKGEMIWDGKVLTSSPPKYKHICDGCGNQEIWDAIIGQGKNES